MTSELGDARYEIKMVFENLHRFEVENWVRLHSFGFCTAFPTRQVNNIYFDTIAMDTFWDHVEGTENRRKLRFRWYGENLFTAKGHLEVKQKKGLLGWKSTQIISKNIQLTSENWDNVLFDLRKEANGVFQEMLAVSRPTLINTYQRQYFVSADKRVRLTLDYDMRGYEQIFVEKPNVGFHIPSRDFIIIEIKAPFDQAKALSNVLAEFPLYVEAFSKYVDMTSKIVEQ